MRIRGSAFVLLLVCACNSSMQGEKAPQLPPVGWLNPDGSDAGLETRGRWILVGFFSPG